MTDTDRPLCDCPEPCGCYAEGYAEVLASLDGPAPCRGLRMPALPGQARLPAEGDDFPWPRARQRSSSWWRPGPWRTMTTDQGEQPKPSTRRHTEPICETCGDSWLSLRMSASQRNEKPFYYSVARKSPTRPTISNALLAGHSGGIFLRGPSGLLAAFGRLLQATLSDWFSLHWGWSQVYWAREAAIQTKWLLTPTYFEWETPLNDDRRLGRDLQHSPCMVPYRDSPAAQSRSAVCLGLAKRRQDNPRRVAPEQSLNGEGSLCFPKP